MQVKKIAAVCALACAAMAGTAHAALPAGTLKTTVDTANSNGRVIFISGASAVQKGFADIIADTFDSPTYFSLDSKAASSADFVAVAGTFKSGAGVWGGQSGIIIYRVKGGSVWGVNPVARNEGITSLAVNSTDCTTSGAGTAASPYHCPTVEGVKPDAGVSDVAPKFFKSPLNTEGEEAAPELTPAELGVLTSTPLYGLAFGIPVTSNVPADIVFTKPLVASLMAGNIGTWSKIKAGETGEVVICRRVPGSGTQAVMNMWAGNYPCTATANEPADRTASEDIFDGSTFTVPAPGETGSVLVIENSTSGQVRDCLNKAVTGGTYATSDRSGNPVTVDFGDGGHKAIGVLSMDSLKDSKTSGNWQFRSLNGAGKIAQDTSGAAPTTSGTGTFPLLSTYESGDWDLQGWISFNVPARTNLIAGKKGVLDLFIKNAQNPAKLQAISDLKFVTAGIPGKGYTGDKVLDAAYVKGDQCAPYNRLTTVD